MRFDRFRERFGRTEPVSSSCLLQIRGFPTIKIFRKGEEPEDYQGGRSRGDIIARGLDLFADNAPPPELVEVSEHLDTPVSRCSLVSHTRLTPNFVFRLSTRTW